MGVDSIEKVSERRKCLYLHGLGAVPNASIESAIGEDCDLIQPKIDYSSKELAAEMDGLMDQEWPDFIVGHSAGGVLAFYLAKKYDKPALLLCPSFGEDYVDYTDGKYEPKITAIIGAEDDEIPKEDQEKVLLNRANCSVKELPIGHDVPEATLKAEVEAFQRGLLEG